MIIKELEDYWHFDKNRDLSLETISVGSAKNAWFKCEEGHEWRREVRRFFKDPACPYCSGKKAIPGITDLLTVNVHIGNQWHPTKNEGLNPSTILPGSHKLVWWQCDKGHEWKTSIKSRCGRNLGCPYCGKHFVTEGVNDLLTLYPDIAAEWHPTKNGNDSAIKTKPGSHKLIWWQCDKGHEWKAQPNNRVGLGNGCPYCGGQKILRGYNDLATLRPKLIKEWHPTKNILDPYQISPSSKKKAWWQCKKGHVWKATIGNRTNANSGCPECARGKNSSKLEKEIVDLMKENYDGNIKTNNRTVIKPRELDILLEENNLAIEINGVYWHSISLGRVSEEYHFNKWQDCLASNINLIQIWDRDYSNRSQLIKERLLVALTGQRFEVNSLEINMDNGILTILDKGVVLFSSSYLIDDTGIELFNLEYKEGYAAFDWVSSLNNFFVEENYLNFTVTIENDWSTDGDYLKAHSFELKEVIAQKRIPMPKYDVYNSGYSVFTKSLG